MMGCAPASLELVETSIDRSGGTLHVRGDVASHGALIVSVDGVPGRGVVVDGPRSASVEVPALPREGIVDVQLQFADGHAVVLESALEVAAPRLR